jgi:hypothetical protein
MLFELQIFCENNILNFISSPHSEVFSPPIKKQRAESSVSYRFSTFSRFLFSYSIRQAKMQTMYCCVRSQNNEKISWGYYQQQQRNDKKNCSNLGQLYNYKICSDFHRQTWVVFFCAINFEWLRGSEQKKGNMEEQEEQKTVVIYNCWRPS